MVDFDLERERDMGMLNACVLLLRAMLLPKVHLAFENLALLGHEVAKATVAKCMVGGLHHRYTRRSA